MSTAASETHYQTLRRLGGQAHQLRAAVRAANRFLGLGPAEDRDTASWLISSGVGLGHDLADELDRLARALREAGADNALGTSMQNWRVLAHQLHAAARAADLYLEQDSPDEHDTGSWLVACALGLADRLVAALDDGASQVPRPGQAPVPPIAKVHAVDLPARPAAPARSRG